MYSEINLQRSRYQTDQFCELKKLDNFNLFFYQSSRIVKKVPSSLTGSVEKDIEKSSSFRQEYVEQAEENGKTVEKIMIGVAD